MGTVPAEPVLPAELDLVVDAAAGAVKYTARVRTISEQLYHPNWPGPDRVKAAIKLAAEIQNCEKLTL
mgnify:CR=1 FL=1